MQHSITHSTDVQTKGIFLRQHREYGLWDIYVMYTLMPYC